MLLLSVLLTTCSNFIYLALAECCSIEKLGLYGLSKMSSGALLLAVEQWPKVMKIEIGGWRGGSDMLKTLSDKHPHLF